MTFPNCGDTFVISLRPLDYEAYTMIVFISSVVCFSLMHASDGGNFNSNTRR